MQPRFDCARSRPPSRNEKPIRLVKKLLPRPWKTSRPPPNVPLKRPRSRPSPILKRPRPYLLKRRPPLKPRRRRSMPKPRPCRMPSRRLRLPPQRPCRALSPPASAGPVPPRRLQAVRFCLIRPWPPTRISPSRCVRLPSVPPNATYRPQSPTRMALRAAPPAWRTPRMPRSPATTTPPCPDTRIVRSSSRT